MLNFSFPKPSNYLWIFIFLLSINRAFSQDRLENISVSGKVIASESKEGIHVVGESSKPCANLYHHECQR